MNKNFEIRHGLTIDGNVVVDSNLDLFVSNVSVSGDGNVSGTLTVNELVATNPIAVSSGGTGADSLAANSVLVGNATGSVKQVSGAAGQVLFLAANGAPIFGNIDGGTY